MISHGSVLPSVLTAGIRLRRMYVALHAFPHILSRDLLRFL